MLCAGAVPAPNAKASSTSSVLWHERFANVGAEKQRMLQKRGQLQSNAHGP
jgi:hypothetical protein